MTTAAPIIPTDTTAEAMAFIRAKFMPDDIVEMRCCIGYDKPAPSRWSKASEFAELLPWARVMNEDGYNIYVGTNPRPEIGEKTDACIRLAHTIHADIEHISEQAARERIAKAGLPEPAIVVDSGHGIHFYWILAPACEDMAAWRELIADLARLLDADTKVQNPERIMRLPGFFNHKDGESVLSRLLDIKPSLVDFAMIRAIVPVEKKPEPKPTAPPPRSASTNGNGKHRMSPVERCRRYLDKAPNAIAGQFGHDRLLYASTTAWRFGLSESEVLDILNWFSATKSNPPWSDKEIRHKLSEGHKLVSAAGELGIKLRDDDNDHAHNDHAHNGKPATAFQIADRLKQCEPAPDLSDATAEPTKADEEKTPPEPPPEPIKPQTLRAMRAIHKALRAVLIENLARIGETVNVISASKIGKTWGVYDLAVSMAAGIPWLDMFAIPTAHPVLIIDNELHPETITNRIPKVAKSRGVEIATVEEMIQVQALRGKLMDLLALRKYLRQFRPGYFGAIIVDAFYRTLPENTDENDNGSMAGLYNIIDQAADELQCCFVFVHHASKGNQSAKQVTDVGSGAGSMSRATDTHLILRHHEEQGAVVLDAAVRSFPPLEPRCLRWDFPIWKPAPELDPADLRRDKPRASKIVAKPEKPVWTPESFVAKFVTKEPQPKDTITITAALDGTAFLSERRAAQLLKAAAQTGKVYVWKGANPAEAHRFSTDPQPLIGGK